MQGRAGHLPKHSFLESILCAKPVSLCVLQLNMAAASFPRCCWVSHCGWNSSTRAVNRALTFICGIKWELAVCRQGQILERIKFHEVHTLGYENKPKTTVFNSPISPTSHYQLCCFGSEARQAWIQVLVLPLDNGVILVEN